MNFRLSCECSAIWVIWTTSVDTIHWDNFFIPFLLFINQSDGKKIMKYNLRIHCSLEFLCLISCLFLCLISCLFILLRCFTWQTRCYGQKVIWVNCSTRVVQKTQVIEHSHDTQKFLSLTFSLDIFFTQFGNFQLVWNHYQFISGKNKIV